MIHYEVYENAKEIQIPKEINISEVKAWNMYDIDLSSDRRYSALVNGERIMTMTDGLIKRHMTIEQWVQMVLTSYLERYNNFYEANK